MELVYRLTLCFAGGRQSGAILYNAFGIMGHSENGGKTGMSKSNGSTGSQTGSGYSTDVSDDNLPHDTMSPASDVNEHSDSDEQVRCEILRCAHTVKYLKKQFPDLLCPFLHSDSLQALRMKALPHNVNARLVLK